MDALTFSSRALGLISIQNASNRLYTQFKEFSHLFWLSFRTLVAKSSSSLLGSSKSYPIFSKNKTVLNPWRSQFSPGVYILKHSHPVFTSRVRLIRYGLKAKMAWSVRFSRFTKYQYGYRSNLKSNLRVV
jgi:hypothetical protein